MPTDLQETTWGPNDYYPEEPTGQSSEDTRRKRPSLRHHFEDYDPANEADRADLAERFQDR